MKKEILIGALVGLGAFVGVTAVTISLDNDGSRNSQVTSIKERKKSTIEIKQERKTEAIPFETTYYDDNTLANGSTRVDEEGINGVKTITYAVTYTGGIETNREIVTEEVTTEPVNKVVARGTYIAPAKSETQNCPNGTYVNSAGNTVCRPTNTNAGGATAICGDGTYSYSQSRRGTCSHHGGVKRWL